MRNAFVTALIDVAKKDKRIMLLSGDLGFNALELYIQSFPRQYINAGVAEQNMTGVASGLALEGYIPVIYSIIPFITMRNFEQVRNDICYQHLHVKLVGIGAGFSYGTYGYTHYGIEEVSLLRTLPGLTIVAPGDPVETKLATHAMIKKSGPVYMRLGRSGETVVHAKRPRFTLGKGMILREGSDGYIITTSTMLSTALIVSENLLRDSLSIGVINIHTIKPFDEPLIIRVAKRVHFLVTVEEHSIIGGLGSIVSEIIAERGLSVTFKRFGVADRFIQGMGKQEFMRKANGLSVDHLVREIKRLKQL